jgi:deoxyuridine 5'-triphosphate nucleotidohydrolase
METLYFVRTTSNAYAPENKTALAAGYDLKAAYNCTVPANDRALVQTDLKIRVPENTYGRIAPRSGLALHKFIDVGGGVIDSDYTGIVGIILYNHSKHDYSVKKGERIAQLIVEKIQPVNLVEVSELPTTSRGSEGFGHSGRF